MNQEDALRNQSLCPHLRKLDILSKILEASHKRSLEKFEQNDREDDFTDYMEAPDIICELKIKQKLHIIVQSNLNIFLLKDKSDTTAFLILTVFFKV